jgi:hypothetical protein
MARKPLALAEIVNQHVSRNVGTIANRADYILVLQNFRHGEGERLGSPLAMQRKLALIHR